MALLPGFKKAQSDNLPKMDSFTVFSFLGNNPSFMGAEIKGFKAQRCIHLFAFIIFLCHVQGCSSKFFGGVNTYIPTLYLRLKKTCRSVIEI